MSQTILVNNLIEFGWACFLIYVFSFLENTAFIIRVWIQIGKQIQYMLIHTFVCIFVFLPFYGLFYLGIKRIYLKLVEFKKKSLVENKAVFQIVANKTGP